MMSSVTMRSEPVVAICFPLGAVFRGSRAPCLLPGTGRGTGRRPVEGINAIETRRHDRFHHILDVPNDVCGAHPEQMDVLLAQPGISRLIASGALAEVMANPIDLDRQQRSRTEEIEDVAPSRMLA